MPRALLKLLTLLGAIGSLPASPLPHRTPPARDAGPSRLEATSAPIPGQTGEQQAAVQDRKSRAMRLRAAYVSKIPAYITPAAKAKNSTSPFVIAVVGNDVFADAIRKLLPGKTIHKRKVKVVVVDPTIAATTTKHTHDLLYVATSINQAVVKRILESHKQLATPLMSSRPAFASKGGGLQLFIKNNKVKFEVNHKALKAQGMKVSSQLLKLSTKGPLK